MGIDKNMLLLLSQDPKITDSLVTSLNLKGFQIYSAQDQSEAVRKIRTKAVDLIICDISQMDPKETLLQDYLKKQVGPGAPVILIASDLSDEQKQWFKRLPGVKAMLPKPLDIRQVERLIQSNLSREGSVISVIMDDDSDRPLVDPKDRLSVEIGVTLQLVENGAPSGPVHSKDHFELVEYSPDSLLIEVRGQAFKKGTRMRVTVTSQFGDQINRLEFDGDVLDVENLEGDRSLITVDSRSASTEFSKEIARQVESRQNEALGFIKTING